MLPDDMLPEDMLPDRPPPLPNDPPIRAMAGSATDPATRKPIATARRGMDLFMVKSFRALLGNADRFPSDPRAMDRFTEVLAPDCCRLLVLADISTRSERIRHRRRAHCP
ncbi:hypothetical protein RSO01_10670 [Reyranella soli]|uniref:Uncharacterized protein n=1 Tax=Reyranella soli TaxID=1230389 RepID=A0A512N5H8_9HYPH|nr:hypothetical protein RSO01_10670 [Reyranella soli]